MLLVGLPAALAVLVCSGLANAGPAFLHLEIGDPARRGREVPLVLDRITDSATGTVITPAEMVKRLADTGLLFIGENHGNKAFHEVELRTIQALHETGREVLIGVEMLPYTAQRELDNWNSGHYTEQQFVDQGRWADRWSYDWNYYRDIFLYAQAKGIRLYAVNFPREVVKRARLKGFQSLTAEEVAHLPPELAAESDEHRLMYRTFFGPDNTPHMNDDAFAGLYRAQVLWDAAIGWNALQALKQQGGPKAIMVVLVGAGHVAFGLGAERQAQPWFNGRISSLIPVPVVDSANQPVEQVRASYANFVWGVPRETEPLSSVTSPATGPTTGRPPRSASGE